MHISKNRKKEKNSLGKNVHQEVNFQPTVDLRLPAVGDYFKILFQNIVKEIDQTLKSKFFQGKTKIMQ